MGQNDNPVINSNISKSAELIALIQCNGCNTTCGIFLSKILIEKCNLVSKPPSFQETWEINEQINDTKLRAKSIMWEIQQNKKAYFLNQYMVRQ